MLRNVVFEVPVEYLGERRGHTVRKTLWEPVRGMGMIKIGKVIGGTGRVNEIV